MDAGEISRRIAEAPLETDWLLPQDLMHLLKTAADNLMGVGNIVTLSGPTVFCGDIHGDIDSMLAAFKVAADNDASIVFLGDVVDRGSHDVECVNYLLARLLLEPDRVFYTRGNHEFKGINSRWGFMDSVAGKYPETVYWLYNAVFMSLPLAVLHSGNLLALHGGISRHARTLADMEALQHHAMTCRDDNMDLLWNDPSEEHDGWQFNRRRGIFWTFGRDVFDNFMADNGLELMVRAHSVQEPGYRYYFDNRLLSIFTSGDFYTDTRPSVALVADASHEIIRL